MNKMQKKVLRESIASWEQKVRDFEKTGKFDASADTCPCCQMRIASIENDWERENKYFECIAYKDNKYPDCPIAAYTSEEACYASPYEYAVDNDRPEIEVLWLKHLLEDKDPPIIINDSLTPEEYTEFWEQWYEDNG